MGSAQGLHFERETAKMLSIVAQELGKIPAAIGMRKCLSCDKYLEASPKRLSCNPIKCGSCRRGKRRPGTRKGEYSRLSIEQRRERNRAIGEWRRRIGYNARPDIRAKRIAQKRRWRQHKAAEAGRELLPPNGALPFEQKQSRLAERNARQAWQWWLQHATDSWLRAYYSALGRPWINPRLSGAERYRLRYAHDRSFHATELRRLRRKKAHRQGLTSVAATGVRLRDLAHVRASSAHCSYCGRSLTYAERTIDHIISLDRAGKDAHTLPNLTVACRSCNSRLGAREKTKGTSSDRAPRAPTARGI